MRDALIDGPPTLAGIDHGFSFPQRYFERHGIRRDWDFFLEDFEKHWPTRAHRVVAVEKGRVAAGGQRRGEPTWRRSTEIRAGAAKSVFNFWVSGQVAYATHAGLPWLRFLRQELGERLHVWPFDGWEVGEAPVVLAEVYPSLWSGEYDRAARNPDQQDAFSVASWLRDADGDGRLAAALRPELSAEERRVAELEGWILSVG